MSKKMPVLFFGHGSPMNAIADNAYTRRVKEIGQQLEAPKAILCVSAHWMSQGTFMTSSPQPKTIYDMYGFPEALYQVKYPAKGDPVLAETIGKMVDNPKIQGDGGEWGLDHGTWSVLVHLFPKANIPVVQLSIDMGKDFRFHFDLGKKLAPLRDQGVLILGSGNVVHNLRRISWEESAPVMPWAANFSAWFNEKLLAKDYTQLVEHSRDSEDGKLAIPTTDHYIPCLYTLGASLGEEPKIEYDEIQNGSIAMTCFSFGR